MNPKPLIEHRQVGHHVAIRKIDKVMASRLAAAIEKAFAGKFHQVRIYDDGLDVETFHSSTSSEIAGYAVAWLEREAARADLDEARAKLDAMSMQGWEAVPPELAERAYFTAEAGNEILHAALAAVIPGMQRSPNGQVFTQIAAMALHYTFEAHQSAQILRRSLASIGGLPAEKEAARAAELIGQAVEILSFRLLSLRGVESGSGRPRSAGAPPTPPSPPPLDP